MKNKLFLTMFLVAAFHVLMLLLVFATALRLNFIWYRNFGLRTALSEARHGGYLMQDFDFSLAIMAVFGVLMLLWIISAVN